ncbi:MAG: class I adenylate-forming enzyme family protein [Phycisphaerae bacterium]
MLVDTLLKARQEVPKKLAVYDGIREFSYKRLTMLAGILREVVLRETKNDKVGLMLPASGAFPGALYGTLWAEKTAVPLNFLLNEQELKVVVEDAGLDLIITIKHFEKLASQLPARTIFLEELGLRRRMLVAMISRTPPPPKVTDDDLAILLYTSGTTGIPKGVQLTYGNLSSNCTDAIHTLAIDPDQVFLNVLPPFHVFGVTAMVLLPVMLQATVLAMPRFSPLGMIKMVEERGVTITVAIPSMYAAILKTKSAKANAFKDIYLAISGGEPLPDSVRSSFLDRFGIEIREGYGLTETSPIVATNTPQHTRVGSVGKMIRNVNVKIAGEDGQALPAGQDGEILVSSPGVMKGYYGRPEDTAKVIDPEGWFHTGDVGRLDDDGFLFITGRVKDMMIIGGENVFPREIEAVLETHPDVLQVAVIGIPDDLRGEVPAAFVIPQPNTSPTEQELRNLAKTLVAGFKVPRRIIISEDLPKGPTGKLLKRKLKDVLTADAGAGTDENSSQVDNVGG